MSADHNLTVESAAQEMRCCRCGLKVRPQTASVCPDKLPPTTVGSEKDTVFNNLIIANGIITNGMAW